MMREILFRGKVPRGHWRGREWLIGSLVIEHDGGAGIYTDAVYEGNGRYVVPVDPETVGQWTGRWDNYGEDIYEGDLVLIDGKTEPVYTVDWYAGALVLIAYDGDGFADEVIDFRDVIAARLTVIDNIHDQYGKG